MMYSLDKSFGEQMPEPASFSPLIIAGLALHFAEAHFLETARVSIGSVLLPCQNYGFGGFERSGSRHIGVSFSSDHSTMGCNGSTVEMPSGYEESSVIAWPNAHPGFACVVCCYRLAGGDVCENLQNFFPDTHRKYPEKYCEYLICTPAQIQGKMRRMYPSAWKSPD